ncbi:MAG: hypothetical protein ABI769_04290 [Pseudomonadota bacterium]
MKTAFRMGFWTALAAFSVQTSAQDHTPNKYKNASPEVRAAYGLRPVATEKPLVVDVALLRTMAGRDGPACASVKVSAPVKFRNRILIEIPDITEPDLRLANQLMSTGCFARAVDKLEAVTRTDPDNRHAKYVVARMSWMLMSTAVAEQVLTQALAAHKDFLSAKVLLAGIRFEQENVPDAATLLDEVEPRSPTDLWVYLGRLRIETLRSPSRDLRLRLVEIIRSPAFPPNAREVAADIAKLLPQNYSEYEEVLWARLDIDSNLGMACKVHDLAFWLSEVDGKFPEVIKLLESPRAKEGHCLGLDANRTLLAQAYLMEAAKISAGPSPANKHLIDRADQVLNGDYTSVAAHVQGRPQYATLQPFLAAYVQPDEEDVNGVTKLCHAIGFLNVAVVREQLEAGADPNGRCRDESLVGSLVFMATVEKDERRREIMRALLEHGARVTNIDSCRSPNNGDCAQVLLPLMEKYSKSGK